MCVCPGGADAVMIVSLLAIRSKYVSVPPAVNGEMIVLKAI